MPTPHQQAEQELAANFIRNLTASLNTAFQDAVRLGLVVNADLGEYSTQRIGQDKQYHYHLDVVVSKPL